MLKVGARCYRAALRKRYGETLRLRAYAVVALGFERGRARRQARVLTSGRRRHLVKLAARLGLGTSPLPSEPVPRRLRRPHRLIGWRPPEPADPQSSA